ncbi:hypothetical protein SAMN04487968_101500 [Nocardioides terrae]|uniref:YdbS-like PH domain-containing protein n=1 Tax=Nocardioides terrae TaxID=574651 RepID=A0A1I1DU73_9ACTN|nr:PH domain-containing protein [Nocardioides terrae]SFB78431.1 hypothetical protein SAMN04487968_101500 [Nocardioides terrae]
MSLPPLTLREPSQRVSPKATTYWRVQAAFGAIAAWAIAIGLVVTVLLVPSGWWSPLLWLAAVVLVVVPLPALTVAPRIRYDVHRWEVTDIAVHVRYGWISRTDEIVPLSRVQTVDSAQGPLMRVFGLRTVKVQTASRYGIVSIACLDDAVAQQVVSRLVAITAATPEDAT